MDSISIGLDIGSTGIRAAEVGLGRDGRSLRRYAQVGLPTGAVSDGEIVNTHVVADALRRLWRDGGFTSTKVVLGVSGHRVIVRQADVPALDEEDLRSALKFDAQELIPIPMDDAGFDFTILDRGQGPDADGRSTMRILLVAAHRDMLRTHMATLKAAGLSAVAIEASPLSLMRVVPPTPPTPSDGGGSGNRVDALVAIGGELTTVAVRENGVPRFIRSLAVGGSKLTNGIAAALHVEPAVAERLKRGAVPEGTPQLVQARKVMTTELRDLAEDVRATIDFFVAQSDGTGVETLLITGGASETEGLAEELAGTTTVEVRRVDPFSLLNVGDIDLSRDDMERARAGAATAVGLALWPLEPKESRLSILPDDIAVARRTRRTIAAAGVGVLVVAGALGVASVAQLVATHVVRDQAHSAQAHANVLKGQVAKLQTQTAAHSRMIQRESMVRTALAGDIDWVRLFAQIGSVMPPGSSLTQVTANRTLVAQRGALVTSGVGTIKIEAAAGNGGLPLVSAWIEGLQRLAALQGTWVPNVTVKQDGGSVTWSSNSYLTPAAESGRSKAVK